MELGVWKIISVIAMSIMNPSVLAARPKGMLAKCRFRQLLYCLRFGFVRKTMYLCRRIATINDNDISSVDTF